MRSTIACERRSKIKCVHQGDPPCRTCENTGKAETCVLSRPVIRRHEQRALVTPSALHGVKRKHGNSNTLPPAAQESSQQSCGSDGQSGPCGRTVSQHFASVPARTYAHAISIFRAQFSEYGFIQPSDLERPRDLSDCDKLRLVAILAVVCRYMDGPFRQTQVEHANVVTRELQNRLTSPPNLSLIQGFLIMALYEWGEGQGYVAWIYAGTAVRMSQAFAATRQEANDTELRSMDRSPALSEVETRTFWTCFILDKLLSCGKQRPAMMNLEDIELPLPVSDEDFAFGRRPAEPITYQQLIESLHPTSHSIPTGYHFRITVMGINIWSKIHNWVAMGGRKQSGMTDPQNCPWHQESQWSRMKQELSAWRDAQESCLKYSETAMAAHIHLRRGEVFAYVNLIYYLSIIFLCREFIPFLPVSEKRPRGPIDAPLLKESAPDGWWDQNSYELFNAARQISSIMRGLREANVCLYTPFTGLCVFTATLMNLYAAAFPALNRCETGNREKLAAEGMAELDKIAELWKMGKTWADVVHTARNLYRQVMSNQGQHWSHSRDDYVHLERSINLARDQDFQSTGGTPEVPIVVGANQPTAPSEPTEDMENSVDLVRVQSSRPHVSTEDPVALGASQTTAPSEHIEDIENSINLAQAQGAQPTISTSGAPHIFGATETAIPPGSQIVNVDSYHQTQPLGADMEKDSWRLWTFWDDPHLLPFELFDINLERRANADDEVFSPHI